MRPTTSRIQPRLQSYLLPRHTSRPAITPFSFKSCYHTSVQRNQQPKDINVLLQEIQNRTTEEHLKIDREHVWHPYTSLIDPTPVLPVRRAEKCTIELEDGTKLLDGMASWWAAIWGYNNPQLNAAMQRQLRDMSHVMFGGLTHRPATELTSILLHMTTNLGLEKVFYCDSGSVAVEVSLKMAIQYFRGIGTPGKTKFVSLRSGYHGDTLGAMSVCDPVTGMHSAFKGVLAEQFFSTRPPCDEKMRVGAFKNGCNGCTCENNEEDALRDLENILSQNHSEIAALIVEPLVQGAGGMRFYNESYLVRMRELCTEYDILLICDEIATGFGRSGGQHLFASGVAGIKPDIMCIGKALTGGCMSLGAVLTTENVARLVSSSPDPSVASLPLMHGPTFMGNPLALSVSFESTSMMLQQTSERDPTPLWQSNVHRIEQQLRHNLEGVIDMEGVADVRVRGAIGVIEMDSPIDSSWVTPFCKETGVWLRPFGTKLYTMPPYVMTNEELKKVTDAMISVATEHTKRAEMR